MRTIRLGNRGNDVMSWQTFLRGGQINDDGSCSARKGDAVQSDGVFGPITDKATRVWQERHGLEPDGVVGRRTWKHAVGDSFPAGAVPTAAREDHDADVDQLDIDDAGVRGDRRGAAWPPRPAWAKPLSRSQRKKVLGEIDYVASPTVKNPERIKVLNSWSKKNIKRFDIPQLYHKPISMHRLAGPQFQAWLAACERKGVLNITGYGGCWVSRFVRGSTTRLSNHTWASAVDINVPYNRRGRQSALVGQKGCVREMAQIGYDFGIFWGGHYRGAPEDGMHFELFRVLTDTELQAAKDLYGVA
jgi:peptidoglycan hydrolase-like protein with peptidoglycan-binding domain